MTKENTKDIFEPASPTLPPDWEVLPFKEAVDVISDQGKRIKKKQYLRVLKSSFKNLTVLPRQL